MRKDYTDIVMVVDRSGSMQDCRGDAEGGVNSFIKDQAKLPGFATLTLVQFDTEYEFIHTAKPIGEVEEYRLHPRGNTALLDAVGRAIAETGQRFDKMAEADRPGLVCFVIVTDGQENSSREFTFEKVKEVVTQQRDKYNWQFTFIGAGMEAFAQAGAMGIAQADAAVCTSGKIDLAYNAVSAKTARSRLAFASGAPVASSFTDSERSAIS